MSYLVKDFLGRKGKKGDLGIEIEMEAEMMLPEFLTGNWLSKPDGTLLNGMEYVTSGPVAVADKKGLLQELFTRIDPKKFKLKENSSRASIHVHSNFLYNTPVQYWTSATAYWLSENLLFNYVDPYRKGNCFCLRLADAEGVLKTVFNDLRRDYPFTKLGTDTIRYAGQNLAATAKFGSIEYRGMSFSLDKDKIDTWTSELYNLNSKVNKSFRSPDHLMDTYLEKGPGDFLSKIFGASFVSSITKQKGWENELEKNEGLVSELAYFHDWSTWEKKINKTISEGGPRKILYNGRDPDAPPRRTLEVNTITATVAGRNTIPPTDAVTTWDLPR